uniref:Marasmius rotula UPO n=2 Tax=Marasmius rotula TaxID=182057 RepID=UPI002016A75C|nr:Chain A, Marasmius rotula UPO [Marasmius rotula]7ZBP_B Chain B, Marasmius rotula UPO [Marasmius rotula]7ZBP_C Chain C, Marasmius rotula UPO [Marasmius rotula]7ZBP_D Chain D, Marasmius rotula UPO [Marasmius rotula]
AVDFSAHPWKAPGPNDSRGPCPGLNTLANHGFLPRNGRNISVPMIVKAGFEGYNVQSDILILAGKIGMLTSREADTISLEDLKLHGTIEHDASLSREDVAIGDNLHFNEAIFTTLANSNPGADVYNISSAAQVQHDRLADSLARNPNVTNTDLTATIRSSESAFFLTVMSAGDPLRGEAPKKFVNVFFREERMPIKEGWKRSTTPITIPLLGPIIERITELSDWKPTGDNCGAIVLSPE